MALPVASTVPSLTIHDWACLRTELMWAYDKKVQPRHTDHTDDFSVGNRAWFVRQGKVEIKGPGQRILRATKGMWLFPPPEKARQIISRDTHLLSLQFLCQWPSGDPLFTQRQGLVLKGSQCPDLEKKAVPLARLVTSRFPDALTVYGREKASFDFFLEAHSLFQQWLAEWFRVRLRHGATITTLTPRDDRISVAVRCLNEAPLDQGFPAGALKKQTSLGEAHLNRLFIRAFQLSTRKYWEGRRLEFAKSCLESSIMPVKEIAWRLGFKSASHFVVWFRRLDGRRPGQYRAESSLYGGIRLLKA